jgi:3-isopropylmalate/(R)-2-methylmalate dehydratase small subunit
MQAFTVVESTLAGLMVEHIDTDQIIPARFLTTTTRQGLGKHAFADWRYAADGTPKPEFVLNQAQFAGAAVLLAGHNFGCGSSREHAPWALLDAGIRCVISSQIADIFRNNASKNGLLPIVLPAEQIDALKAHIGSHIRVDLTQNEIQAGALRIRFEIESFARECLLHGVDQLGFLLKQTAAIDAFEARQAALAN